MFKVKYNTSINYMQAFTKRRQSINALYSTISLPIMLQSKSANNPYLIHILHKFLFLDRVGSAIPGSILNEPSSDVIYMK